MSGDPLMGMMLISLFALVGGGAMGSYLLKFYDKKRLHLHANTTAATFILAVLISFVTARYTASCVTLVIAVFFGGMGMAESKPEESR